MESQTDRVQRAIDSLLTRRQLLRQGLSARGIAAAVADGQLVRVAPSRYVKSETWVASWPEDQLLMRIFARAGAQGKEAVFALESAAVLLGLPLYRLQDPRPRVLLPQGQKVIHSAGIRRRTGAFGTIDIEETQGVRHTNLDRTVIDSARFLASDVALGIAEAALGKMFPGSRRGTDPEPIKTWRDEMLASLDALGKGARGVRRARQVLEIADATADSVYESVGKLRFLELGYRVRTQVPVRKQGSGFYYVDLEIEGLNILVEIDGRVKYADLDLRGNESLDELMYRERQRENWIVGVTGKRLIRLRAADLVSAETLAQRLRAYGVALPPLR